MDINTQALKQLSRYAGNRFDLVQAGGGNSSVKLNETDMLVKASGINLSQVSENQGYVRVDYQQIRCFLASFDFVGMSKKEREKIAANVMKQSQLDEKGKPSIETFLHALLSKYTLHTHPVAVNILAAVDDWKTALLSIYSDAICVPYNTPGIDLAMAMALEMREYETLNGSKPKVVFLQNHGLIVSSNDPEEVKSLTEDISYKIEKSTGLNFSNYRRVTEIQKQLSALGFPTVDVIYSEDRTIAEQMHKEDQSALIWPFCPDTLIYCGVRPVFLTELNDLNAMQEYINVYHDYPRVIVLNQNVYFCAPSLKKAKEAEELFKFHLLVVSKTGSKTQRLSLEEIAYLSNWDAEKYRQGV